MDIEFGDINYKNDKGEIVTREEFDLEWQKFMNAVNEAYESKVNEIIIKINSSTQDDTQKLWMLYDYLTSDNMEYVLEGTTPDGKMALDVKYDFSPYKNWKVSSSTKYPAILNNSGICRTYSLAFEDIANKLGIPCRVVTGNTFIEHMWNIVLINGEVKHIDIAYAIMRRKFSHKSDFFLKDFDELIKLGGSRTINPIKELVNDMIIQNEQLHPQIRIISRTDTGSSPIITIINRTDDEDDYKIRK